MTQVEFSQELGIGQSNYSRYERGAQVIPKYIEKLVQLYIGEEDQADLIDRVAELEEENRSLRKTLKKIDDDIEQSKESLRRSRKGSDPGWSGA